MHSLGMPKLLEALNPDPKSFPNVRADEVADISLNEN